MFIQRKQFIFSFNKFLKSQKFSGVFLLCCTFISIIIANSRFQHNYVAFWQNPFIQTISPSWFINDVLMSVFFLFVGLEIKREIFGGELSSIKKAGLPVVAALGGMIIPATIYFFLNHKTETANGWGIPMATDIAFALGVLSLLGERIPVPLRIILTALAVVDDLGAIIVIAIFYANEISFIYLSAALAILIVLMLLKKLNINSVLPYLVLGCLLWYFVHLSGIHATIAGVLLAFTIPININQEKSLLHRLEHFLNKPVNFFIMPLFALANTAVVLGQNFIHSLTEPLSGGIIIGLVVGKPLGICIFIWLFKKLGLISLPALLKWSQLIGLACLGGIGFTMSIFVSILAFENNSNLQQAAKVSILLASAIASVIGFLILKLSSKNR